MSGNLPAVMRKRMPRIGDLVKPSNVELYLLKQHSKGGWTRLCPMPDVCVVIHEQRFGPKLHFPMFLCVGSGTIGWIEQDLVELL